MRNIQRLNADLYLLEKKYGIDHVEWAKDCSYIYIHDFKLPARYNKAHSEALIFVPENYGYGVGYRDVFLTPGLKINEGGKFRSMDSKLHYFETYPYSNSLKKKADKLNKRGWAYLCLHQANQKPSTLNVLVFLEQLFTYLSNPVKHAL